VGRGADLFLGDHEARGATVRRPGGDARGVGREDPGVHAAPWCSVRLFSRAHGPLPRKVDLAQGAASAAGRTYRDRHRAPREEV